MKKRIMFMVGLLCFLLTACAGPKEAPALTGESGESTAAVQSEPEDTKENSETQDSETQEPEIHESETQEVWIQPGENRPGLVGEPTVSAGTKLDFTEGGSDRIPYTMNQSWAVYVTSAEELARYSGECEELENYDDDFFKSHALLLVTESVNSGSTEVGIEKISRVDDEITVTLSHTAAENGTADMATWLVWAEVECGLEDCRWQVGNAALKPELEIR